MAGGASFADTSLEVDSAKSKLFVLSPHNTWITVSANLEWVPHALKCKRASFLPCLSEPASETPHRSHPDASGRRTVRHPQNVAPALVLFGCGIMRPALDIVKRIYLAGNICRHSIRNLRHPAKEKV